MECETETRGLVWGHDTGLNFQTNLDPPADICDDEARGGGSQLSLHQAPTQPMRPIYLSCPWRARTERERKREKERERKRESTGEGSDDQRWGGGSRLEETNISPGRLEDNGERPPP